MNDNIVLIGFMGSGKTTFGKWISRKYGYSFCDTDEYIEKKEKTTINDIFASKGETAFRDMETETDERTIDVHINRLRDKFHNNPDFEIVTVRGLGYKAVLKQH